MGGNLRIPNEIHRANGTYRKDRHGGEGKEIHITEPIPDPPKWLEREAIEEWMKIVGLMSKYHMLKATDECVLALYCQLYAELQRLRSQFPAAKMVQLRACMNDLGLTPSSRAKIRMPNVGTKPSKFNQL